MEEKKYLDKHGTNLIIQQVKELISEECAELGGLSTSDDTTYEPLEEVT